MKHYILTFIIICASYNISAQIPQGPKNLQSPNVATLGLFGDIPVSLFTGTPSIGVPLDNIQDGDIVIQLSMAYHSAGIRPDQHPGWTGLGWGLQAGGAIYRVVNDMPDDYSNSTYSSVWGKAGYYFNHNVLNTPRWGERPYLREVAQDDKMLLDTEPDEFSFNFSGYSGKFYLNHDGNWQVQCDKPIKVQFNSLFLDTPFDKSGTRAVTNGNFRSFNGFTIYTEDGTAYVFGGDTSAIEYSMNFFNQYYDEWVASAWHLTKIITPKKNESIFEYERGDFTNQMYISVYENLGSHTEAKGGIFNPQPECNSWNYTSIPASYNGKLLAPAYLKSITTPNTKITFTKSPSNELSYPTNTYDYAYGQWLESNNNIGIQFLPILKSQEDGYPNCLNKLKWYKLDEIGIENKDKRLLKKIKFTYNNASNERLLLSSISEGTVGSNLKTYKFDYNEVHLLPKYLSNQTDHWGFYNNTFAHLHVNDYYSQREPSSSAMSYGVLNKITYPTGGYTRFVFEPHSYSKQLSMNRWEKCENMSTNKIAGGLRIKQIINSISGDPQNEIVTKEYFYVTDYLTNKNNSANSSGILGGRIQYGFSNYVVYAFNDDDVKRSMNIFTSQSVLPACDNAHGSHIGYSEVIEKNANGSFTQFKFTNFDNGHMDDPSNAVIQESRTPYEPYASRACERGKLTSQVMYSSEGLKKSSQTYLYERSSNDFVRSMKASYKNVCPGTAVSYDEGTSFKIFTYNYRIIQEKDTVYNNPLSAIATIKSYKYNRNGLIRDIEQTVNNGTKKITYRHPEEFSDKVYSSMISSNILSPIIEESESLLTSSGTILPIRKKRTNYVPLKVVGLWDEFYAISSIEDSISPSVWKKSYECFNFDTKANPISVNINEKPIVYQWGYNKQYPVAIFEGAKNDYKVTPKYQEVWTTESIALKHNNSYQNSTTYNFNTSRPGSVEFHLSGALGYNWYVTGRLDDSRPVQLVQIRTNGSNEPWSRYQNAYSYKVIIDGVAAGAHTFRIDATDSYKGTSDLGNDDGNMTFSYWKSESTSSEITGNNDVLYQNFEDFGTYNIVPFGFHSSKSYAGPYEVELTTNPNKRYTIDYQVLKNGKWCYTTTDFKNGRYTINEGTNPIDEIRVYPKDATVTSCTYIPCVGIRSKTNERGITESYEYDFSGRLVSIKENEQSNIKSFDYKYYNQSSEAVSNIYYNTEIKKEYIKEGCDSSLGEIGQPIEYVVPAKKYSSSISQEDANQKAYDDLIRNGQQYANEHGECSNNIVLSVYNPYEVTYVLNFCWGRQGSLRYDLYPIPPSERINNTGDILQDYKPVIVQLPRNNYRSVNIELEGGYPCDIDFSIRSSEYKFSLMYDINNYPDYRETYVIGGYPFLH